MLMMALPATIEFTTLVAVMVTVGLAGIIAGAVNWPAVSIEP